MKCISTQSPFDKSKNKTLPRIATAADAQGTVYNNTFRGGR